MPLYVSMPLPGPHRYRRRIGGHHCHHHGVVGGLVRLTVLLCEVYL